MTDGSEASGHERYPSELPGESFNYDNRQRSDDDVVRVIDTMNECLEAGDTGRASIIVFHSLMNRTGYLTDYLDFLTEQNTRRNPGGNYNFGRNTIISELEEQEIIMYENLRAYMKIGKFAEALLLAYNQNLVHNPDLFSYPDQNVDGIGYGEEVICIPEEEIDEIDEYIHYDLNMAMVYAIDRLDFEDLWQLLDMKTSTIIEIAEDNPEDIDQIMLNEEIDFAHALIMYLNLFDIPKVSTQNED